MTFSTKLAASYEIIAEGSKADETAKVIEEAFKKVFPKSLVKATFKTNLGAAVTVIFFLA